MTRGPCPNRIVLDTASWPANSPDFRAGKEWGSIVRHELLRFKCTFQVAPYLPPTLYSTSQSQKTEIACLEHRTIFFNVDRADQLDCRRWRDNIKKVVRQTLRVDPLCERRPSADDEQPLICFVDGLRPKNEISGCPCEIVDPLCDIMAFGHKQQMNEQHLMPSLIWAFGQQQNTKVR